jgi:hypothetical protein
MRPKLPSVIRVYTGPHELHTEVAQDRVDYRHENFLVRRESCGGNNAVAGLSNDSSPTLLRGVSA